MRSNLSQRRGKRLRFSKTDLVLPLHQAENAFLEVLLSTFNLRREKNRHGVTLTVKFDDGSPATWNRAGRETVRRRIPRFKQIAERYQARLNRILLESEVGHFAPDCPEFVFRWASAGALPIVNLGVKEYYCLFYRDVFPIGWNIANGATDNSAELIDPLQTLERELGEELVIVDKKRKERYVLRPDKDTLLDRPEFAVFRRFWRKQFPRLDISKFRTAPLPLYWETGPDRVHVAATRDSNTREVRTLKKCFVNINAEDFGIELDRIARITINDHVTLCDGEVGLNRFAVVVARASD